MSWLLAGEQVGERDASALSFEHIVLLDLLPRERTRRTAEKLVALRG